jgi:hypothetical protein
MFVMNKNCIFSLQLSFFYIYRYERVFSLEQDFTYNVELYYEKEEKFLICREKRHLDRGSKAKTCFCE